MSTKLTHKVSSLEELTVSQLHCHIYRHAWYDVDMLPMIWGRSKVEHWRLRCERCGAEATEYRDPVTCVRIGQRQYQLPPGYRTGVAYGQSDYLVELRGRRIAEKAKGSRKGRERRSS